MTIIKLGARTIANANFISGEYIFFRRLGWRTRANDHRLFEYKKQQQQQTLYTSTKQNGKQVKDSHFPRWENESKKNKQKNSRNPGLPEFTALFTKIILRYIKLNTPPPPPTSYHCHSTFGFDIERALVERGNGEQWTRPNVQGEIYINKWTLRLLISNDY